MKSLDEIWQYARSRVEDYLNEFLPSSDTEPAILHSALRYAIFSGGKRFRPLLVYLGAHMGNENLEDEMLLKTASAIELIHNFTLVHDDLPALDDDDYRRGKETVHRRYGEDMGILVGDALFVLAYELLSQVPSEIFSIVNSALLKVIEGQVMDVRKMANSPEDVFKIHEYKTAKLIRASLLSGYMIATGRYSEDVSTIGTNLGRIFQLTDDLIDEADEDELSILQFMERKDVISLVDEICKHTLEIAQNFPNSYNILKELVLKLSRRDE